MKLDNFIPLNDLIKALSEQTSYVAVQHSQNRCHTSSYATEESNHKYEHNERKFTYVDPKTNTAETSSAQKSWVRTI